MKLTADYHTHTKYSHGKNKIIDNAKVAQKRGLTQLGITDHGFSHIVFGMRRKKLAKMKLEASLAEVKTGVRVFLGTEANITSLEGDIDCTRQDELQIIICGFHKVVKTKKGQFIKICLSNILREFFMGKCRYHKANVNKTWVKRNTQALINAMRKNRIDIISHPNRHFRVNVLEVAKVCEETKTAFELNNKNMGISEAELKQIVKETNCKFVLSSDAHSAKKVGDVSKIIKKIDGIVPPERILNIDGKTLSRKSWY